MYVIAALDSNGEWQFVKGEDGKVFRTYDESIFLKKLNEMVKFGGEGRVKAYKELDFCSRVDTFLI